MQKTYVVIPNLNGAADLAACLDSLIAQTQKASVLVVDNASTDNSVEIIENQYPSVEVLVLPKNLGFAGGVNAGIKWAMEAGAEYVALFNNDAVADNNWLANLISVMEKDSDLAIVTCKLFNAEGSHFDSTGDQYTTWGLPYPRGRADEGSDIYDSDTEIFGASGGASLYRISALESIGLFDEDFFAYYEDIDISFRAQLAGWRVAYEPKSIAYHKIGATSSKISGFSTYQTMKNLPWLMWKNVPWALMPTVWPRFSLAYLTFFVSAVSRGQGWPAFKGILVSAFLLPKKLFERRHIQSKRKVSPRYIRSIMTPDLPPNARKLRALRRGFGK